MELNTETLSGPIVTDNDWSGDFATTIALKTILMAKAGISTS
jgi:hypothetical protein